MTYRQFKEINFKPDSLAIIEKANEIIAGHSREGYNLSLRQLYYQFVGKALIENSERSYKRLGSIITDGRLAGLISWDAIEDRHRESASRGHFEEDESSALSGIEYSIRYDFWQRQEDYIEVWVEKDALMSVVSRACEKYRVPVMACKGYLSASEAYRAGERFAEQSEAGKNCYLIHLGDHDPSGIDMTRDNGDRLDLFAGHGVAEVKRIALNMNQIEQYAPPPNPAKITDSRATGYISRFGRQSWELDALQPSVIDKLVTKEILKHIDTEVWNQTKAEQEEARKVLMTLGDQWDRIRPHVVEIMEEGE